MIVGIDLGTTNSLVSVWCNNKCELIPNQFGEYLTPSVISVEDDFVHVGKIAKERLITNPEVTIANFKRFMGTDKKFRLGAKQFTPEELSALVIRQLVEDAKEYLKEEIEEVVISVPAYFNDNQRWSTKTAGALADVLVERLVNEPSAAALAQHIESEVEQSFLVFDFGGGTLDISIVDAYDNIIEIVAVSGDNHLGGEDFNQAITDAFLTHNKINPSTISLNERSILMKQADYCKRKLSETDCVCMKFETKKSAYEMNITNDDLIQICHSILKRMEAPLKKVLRDAQTDVEYINDIILVGGSSKMPIVQNYLEFLTGKKPTIKNSPDEAIALGCGIAAGIKSRNEDLKDMLLTDICPFTLGTSIVNPDKTARSLLFSPIIERNSILPCSKEEQYWTTADNQAKVLVDILQGESYQASDNLSLGVVSIDVPKNKKGKESVSVRMTYDINGLLEVEVISLSTKEKVQKLIISKNSRLGEEEIQKRLESLKHLKVHPRDKSRNKLLLEQLDSLFHEFTREDRKYILELIQYFNASLNSQEDRKIDEAYRKVNEEVEHFVKKKAVSTYFHLH